MRNIASRDASEIEAIEQREWLDSLDYVIQQGDKGRVQRLLDALRQHARVAGLALPFTAETPYVNTIRAGGRSPAPGSQEIERRIKSLVRWNAMAMVVRAQPRVGRHRRAHLDVCVGGDALRSRVQPFLPRAGGRTATGGHHLLPGPRVAGHLRARVSRRAAAGREAAQLPPRARARRRTLVVSAPVADAGLLAVPDGLDGARSDHVDLPGALQPLPRGSRAEEAVVGEGLDVHRRRRDRRAGVARRDRPGVAREARQPDLRHQLQPAAPRRSGPRQRQHRPGARSDLPRRRLERDQGAVGQRLGSAARGRSRRSARQAHGRGRRRAVPEVHRRVRRVLPRALLRRRPATARNGEPSLGRPAEEAAARRSRPGEGLQRLQGRDRAQGTADRHPRAHHQGLRPRRSRRRQEHHAPAEETERVGSAHVPHSLRHSDFRRRDRGRAVLPAAEDSTELEYLRERRKALGGFVPIRSRTPPSRSTSRSNRSSRSSTRAPKAARRRPRWSSCGCCRSCCATRKSAS